MPRLFLGTGFPRHSQADYLLTAKSRYMSLRYLHVRVRCVVCGYVRIDTHY